MTTNGITTTTPPPDLADRIAGYTKPARLLLVGVYYFALTLLSSPFLVITNPPAFKHKAFARLWAECGQALSQEMAPEVADLISTASGVVLDIGPGTGIQLHKFTPSKITRCYGAEPAVDMHPELKGTARKCLLGDKYEVVACGVEPESLIPGLSKAGLLANGTSRGVFDTIVSIRALCSVKNPDETAAGLYRLLKPGGRLILYEHVKQSYPDGGDPISALLQKIYMLVGWSFFLGCRLTNDTRAAMLKAGGPNGWKEIDLASRVPFSTTPYIIGELVKAE